MPHSRRAVDQHPYYRQARRLTRPADAQTSRIRGGSFCLPRDRQERKSMSRTAPAGTPLGDAFHVYDTTLRDGAQREGISYSVADKLAVARHLDALGVGFIEGGWPGALPKDTEFFARAAAGELALRHAALVAFGATRKAGAEGDRGPAGPGPAGQRGAGGHAGGQVRPAAHRAGPAHRRGGELRDGRRHGGPAAGRRPAGVPRRRALLRRLPLRPGHRAAGAGSGRRPRAPTSRCCATPTAACSRWASPRW